jgi:3-deoxy-D-manno-octulosonic-acid transferase
VTWNLMGAIYPLRERGPLPMSLSGVYPRPMSAVSVAYRLAQLCVRAAGPMVGALPGAGPAKLARGIAGRRGTDVRLARWGREGRDPTRPVVWFHAPSVGEGLQARAVIEALRRRREGIQIVFTHFSPSAEALAAAMPADAAGYLPWDLPGSMRPVVEALHPDALVFTKTEVWPVLAEVAAEKRISVTLVAATLPPGAGRLRWPARTLMRPTWASLNRVAAIAAEDGARFVDLGVTADRVVVTGDPGIDSAAQRARAVDPEARYLRPFRAAPRPTLVAGSTWPSDEDVLAPALDRLGPELRVVLAPHEPSAERVTSLVKRFGTAGRTAATLADVESAGTAVGADVVVVDRVGVLAHLYTVGTLAYVGGGFHGAGLHSVLEPAAARLPTTFGPHHRNARAAADLMASGGGVEVADAGALAATLGGWLADPGALDYAGGRAYDYIHAHLGAAERTASILDDLLVRR